MRKKKVWEFELKATEQLPLARLLVCYSHLHKLGVSKSGANEDYAIVQVGQTLSNRSLVLNKIKHMISLNIKPEHLSVNYGKNKLLFYTCS